MTIDKKWAEQATGNPIKDVERAIDIMKNRSNEVYDKDDLQYLRKEREFFEKIIEYGMARHERISKDNELIDLHDPLINHTTESEPNARWEDQTAEAMLNIIEQELKDIGKRPDFEVVGSIVHPEWYLKIDLDLP